MICRATAAPIGPRPTTITRIVMYRLCQVISRGMLQVPAHRNVLTTFLARILISAACVVMLAATVGGRQQPSPPDLSRTQRFDQPEAGARSARNASYDIDVTLDHP